MEAQQDASLEAQEEGKKRKYWLVKILLGSRGSSAQTTEMPDKNRAPLVFHSSQLVHFTGSRREPIPSALFSGCIKLCTSELLNFGRPPPSSSWEHTGIQSFGREGRAQCSAGKRSWHLDSWVCNHFLLDWKKARKEKSLC